MNKEHISIYTESIEFFRIVEESVFTMLYVVITQYGMVILSSIALCILVGIWGLPRISHNNTNKNLE